MRSVQKKRIRPATARTGRSSVAHFYCNNASLLLLLIHSTLYPIIQCSMAIGMSDLSLFPVHPTSQISPGTITIIIIIIYPRSPLYPHSQLHPATPQLTTPKKTPKTQTATPKWPPPSTPSTTTPMLPTLAPAHPPATPFLPCGGRIRALPAGLTATAHVAVPRLRF